MPSFSLAGPSRICSSVPSWMRGDAGAARQRGVERRHAPVVAAPGSLLAAGERRADHHGVGAAGDRLRDVAAGPHAAVGDHVAVLAGLEHVLGARRRDVGDRRRLRDADPEHAARGAGGARADADEDADGAGPHQVQAGRVGGAAADDARAPARSAMNSFRLSGSDASRRRARPRSRCPGRRGCRAPPRARPRGSRATFCGVSEPQATAPSALISSIRCAISSGLTGSE